MNQSKVLGSPNDVWLVPYTQQGDCILKKCGIFGVSEIEHERIPDDTMEVPGNLVLKGQTNSHALYGGKFKLLKHKDTLFVRVLEATVLDHVKDHLSASAVNADHKGQWIPPGDYFHDIVIERDHVTEENRAIID